MIGYSSISNIGLGTALLSLMSPTTLDVMLKFWYTYVLILMLLFMQLMSFYKYHIRSWRLVVPLNQQTGPSYESELGLPTDICQFRLSVTFRGNAYERGVSIFTATLFGLTGLPPYVLFIYKTEIIYYMFVHWGYFLTCWLLLLSVMGLVYHLNIVRFLLVRTDGRFGHDVYLHRYKKARYGRVPLYIDAIVFNIVVFCIVYYILGPFGTCLYALF